MAEAKGRHLPCFAQATKEADLEDRAARLLAWLECSAVDVLSPAGAGPLQSDLLPLLARAQLLSAPELKALSAASSGYCCAMGQHEVLAPVLEQALCELEEAHDLLAEASERTQALEGSGRDCRGRLRRVAKAQVVALREAVSRHQPRRPSRGFEVMQAASLVLQPNRRAHDAFDVQVLLLDPAKVLERAACFEPEQLAPSRRRTLVQLMAKCDPGELAAIQGGRDALGAFAEWLAWLACWHQEASEVVEMCQVKEALREHAASLARWATRPCLAAVPGRVPPPRWLPPAAWPSRQAQPQGSAHLGEAAPPAASSGAAARLAGSPRPSAVAAQPPLEPPPEPLRPARAQQPQPEAPSGGALGAAPPARAARPALQDPAGAAGAASGAARQRPGQELPAQPSGPSQPPPPGQPSEGPAQWFLTPSGGWWCSTCRKVLPVGSPMYGNRKSWDMCESCANIGFEDVAAPPRWAAPAPEAWSSSTSPTEASAACVPEALAEGPCLLPPAYLKPKGAASCASTGVSSTARNGGGDFPEPESTIFEVSSDEDEGAW